MTPNPLFEASLALAQQGIYVLPVRPDGSKAPLTLHGWKDATTDRRRVADIWDDSKWVGERYPLPWIGVVGHLSGLAILDVDPRNGGVIPEGLPPTRTERTPSGGWHFWFRVEAGRRLPNKLGPGLDVLHRGRYAVVAPSPGYEVLSDAPIAPWPDFLCSYIDTGPRRAGTNGTDDNVVERFKIRCPVHKGGQERTPSLQVAKTTDGKTLLHCFAGCDTTEILAVTGMDWDDLFPPFPEIELEWDDAPEGSAGAGHLSLVADITEPTPISEDETDDAALHLPDEFWEARPALRHIRLAAHSRQRSADAVLHAVLARVAAGSPYNLMLPPIVASRVPACYFTVVLAVPGIGKSSASAIAKELLPLPPDAVDGIPIGSGEGLVEVLFSIIEEPDPTNPKKTVKRKVQTRHNAYVYVDEGAVLGKHAERGGATLLETMRTIWTGGVLGQTNATPERGRTVQPGNYVYGMVVGMQPVNAGALLGDVTSGTPQRFTWTLAYDPHIPDSLPLWPGQLDLKSPEPPPEPPCAAPSNGDDEVWFGGTAPGVTVSVDPVVAAEIRAADLAKARTGRVEDLLDTHGDLLQLKTALLLALLDGRAGVTEADWRLAGVVRGVSDGVRSWLVAQIEAEATRVEGETTARLARRAVATSAAVENRRTVDAARKLADKVWAQPDRWTRGTLRVAMKNYRAVFDDALDHAKAEGWVVERTGAGQGEDKRVLRPGGRRLE